MKNIPKTPFLKSVSGILDGLHKAHRIILCNMRGLRNPLHLRAYLFIKCSKKLAQGNKQHQCDYEIPDCVGNVISYTGNPPTDCITKSTGDQVHRRTQQTKQQTKSTAEQCPYNRIFDLTQEPRTKRQNQPYIQIVDRPQVQTKV